MTDIEAFSTWLNGYDYDSLFKVLEYSKYLKNTTLTRVFRGCSIDELPEIGNSIYLTQYGRSYSYDFNVAWEFSRCSEIGKYQVIFNVDNMTHIDIQDVSREIDISDDYNHMITQEKEVICVDERAFRVVSIKIHKTFSNQIYEIILNQQ